MLKREFKIKNSEEIRNTFKIGRKVRGSFITIFITPSVTQHCRAAVVISRKVAGKAVTRNQVRRLIFSKLEGLFAAWENRPVGDMVVMVMSIPPQTELLIGDLDKCLAVL